MDGWTQDMSQKDEQLKASKKKKAEQNNPGTETEPKKLPAKVQVIESSSKPPTTSSHRVSKKSVFLKEP